LVHKINGLCLKLDKTLLIWRQLCNIRSHGIKTLVSLLCLNVLEPFIYKHLSISQSMWDFVKSKTLLMTTNYSNPDRKQALLGCHEIYIPQVSRVRVSSVHLIFKNIKIHQNTILEFEFLFFIILEIDFYPKMPIFFFRKIQITQCLLKLKIEIHFSFIEKRKIRKLKKLTMQGRGKNLIFTHSQALPAING